jgi:hypothetical protein
VAPKRPIVNALLTAPVTGMLGDAPSPLATSLRFLWINGGRREFKTDKACDTVTGIAAVTLDAEYAAGLINERVLRRMR